MLFFACWQTSSKKTYSQRQTVTKMKPTRAGTSATVSHLIDKCNEVKRSAYTHFQLRSPWVCPLRIPGALLLPPSLNSFRDASQLFYSITKRLLTSGLFVCVRSMLSEALYLQNWALRRVWSARHPDWDDRHASPARESGSPARLKRSRR